MRFLGAAVVVCAACAPPSVDHGGRADAGLDAGLDDGAPFAVRVVAFAPGPGAGFGQEGMPDVVLGPPAPGASEREGSLDVVSLGRGGSIVVEVGRPIVDGDGVDLLVFENAFRYGDGAVWSEPGQVSISVDGEAYATFTCAPQEPAPNGCAGFGVVRADVDPTDPDAAGGDGFDLADLGVAEARFVRVVDVGEGPAAGTSTGFDLDAVAVVAR